MNRPIKFRAWDKDFRVMDSWDYIQTYEPTLFLELLQGKLEEKVLMQFTGLLDKNGKEIYEGDIVEVEQIQGYGKFKGVVTGSVRDDEQGPYDWRWWLKDDKGKLQFFHNNPEVISNIYENPELLNK